MANIARGDRAPFPLTAILKITVCDSLVTTIPADRTGSVVGVYDHRVRLGAIVIPGGVSAKVPTGTALLVELVPNL